ncbi:hypothetical protein GCM10023191_013900 [Actinoallomurus oryzae]|jgi:hypothetical membrane protein|uniref:DUF998 domain-containing protein n=2 Tax=Actinoallomurus oryzae TaxID=502180 RepID=A0ABP8PI60_9ACTN
MVPVFAWLLAAIAGITYASWLLQFFLNPELDPVNGYVSELSASDQPYHLLFSAGDFVSGLLTIVVVVAVLRAVRPRGHALAGWLALVLFGVFSIADSLFAMDCAPNSDTTCALRERAGKVSFAHQFHSVTSVCVVTAGIVSLVALTIAARRHRRWPVIARWSWLLLVVETVTAVATLPLMYFGVLLGVIERVQVAMISIWLFVIAAQLHADRRRAPAPAALPASEPPPARAAAPLPESPPVPGIASAAPPAPDTPPGGAGPVHARPESARPSVRGRRRRPDDGARERTSRT